METNDVKSIWSEDFEVSWMDTDMYNHAKLSAIFNYLQEVAWQHAENLGFGYEAARKNGQIWVIVRMLMKISRYPVWRQKIKVETWPRGISGMWAFREYRIKDEAGKVMGGASSSWLVLDAKIRKPVIPEIVLHALPYTNKQPALDELTSKIHPVENMNFLDRHEIGFSEIDAYQHVNNAHYIDWITDALYKFDHWIKINRFHINYLSEAKMHDLVNLKYSQSGDRMMVKGETDSGDKPVFLAEIN